MCVRGSGGPLKFCLRSVVNDELVFIRSDIELFFPEIFYNWYYSDSVKTLIMIKIL